MQQQNDESTITTVGHATVQLARKRYQPPTLRTYGNVRDLTLTSAGGANFDGGGGVNIYAS